MTQPQPTVLLVDDDVDFVDANRVALEAAGYRVLTAHTATQGAELARQNPPDLMVVDLMMEELYSGFSLVQELCAHEETRGIPTIMISAVTTETGFRVDQEGCPPDWLKVVEFMHKPIDPVALARRVGEILAEEK